MNVAAIIPVYNRAKLAKRAVNSVLKQTHKVAEIIVVDDGSKDNLSASLADINDNRLRTFRQPNKGVAAARNLGIENSQSNWLAFLDSDDYWLPSKIEKQVLFHNNHPHIMISQTDEKWKRDGIMVNPKKYHQKQSGEIFDISVDRCMISPSAVMLNKCLLNETGRFDAKLPVCEDYDLWLRICANNRVGLVAEKLVVKIGGHKDQLSSKYWGMDRFRVRALEKLIVQGLINDEQQKTVIDAIIKKLGILRIGAEKRGKTAASDLYDKKRSKYIQKRLEIGLATYETQDSR